MTKAVAKRQPKTTTLKQWFLGDEFKTAVAEVLPKHCTPERVMRLGIAAINKTPNLNKCEPLSVLQAFLDLSQWGLEPDGRRAHLIPYGKTCQLIIDYKGLVELAYRSGVVQSIHADVVCDNDEFEYNLGNVTSHKIDFKQPRGDMYAAYCVVRFKDGSQKTEVMTLEEIKAIQKRAKAGNSGPWKTDFREMAKKTVFRRVSKWLPLSAEIHDAMSSDADQIIEGEVIDRKPAQSLTDLMHSSEQAETEHEQAVGTLFDGTATDPDSAPVEKD